MLVACSLPPAPVKLGADVQAGGQAQREAVRVDREFGAGEGLVAAAEAAGGGAAVGVRDGDVARCRRCRSAARPRRGRIGRGGRGWRRRPGEAAAEGRGGARQARAASARGAGGTAGAREARRVIGTIPVAGRCARARSPGRARRRRAGKVATEVGWGARGRTGGAGGRGGRGQRDGASGRRRQRSYRAPVKRRRAPGRRRASEVVVEAHAAVAAVDVAATPSVATPSSLYFSWT